MELNEMRHKRGTLVKQCRDIVEKAAGEKRDLSADEQKQYDKMFSEQATIGATIAREEQLREVERGANPASGRQTQAAQPGSGAETREQRYDRVVRPVLSKWFQHRGDQLITAEELRALQADVAISGGYLKAPTQMVSELIKGVDNQVFIRQKATKHTLTESDSLGAPSLDTDISDAKFTGEISDADEDTAMSFGRRELKPHPLKKLIKVANKLLKLAPNAESLVRERMEYKLAVPQENAFLNGSGAGEPLGIFTASALGISTARDVSTGNEATGVKADNLIEVKYALKPQYLPKAEWVAHRDFFKRVAKLTDAQGQYLWQPGLQAGQPDRLLNLPINMSEYAPNAFTTGKYVAALGDFSKYWIADVLAAEIKRLDELYAKSSQTGFIIEAHVDGMPVIEEAFVRSKLA